jgi:hypothetical protein
VFPDPSDCKKYYVCSDSGEGELIADEYFCDNYYVFDPSAPNNDYCRFTRNYYCITANCQGQVKNILMNYPFLGRGRGEVVAMCRGSNKPLIFRCGEGFTAKLNSIPVECELTCRGSGKFEYVEDSTKYYDCIWTGRGWEAKIKSCFRNYYFDKTKKQCVVNPTTAAPPSTTTQSKFLALFLVHTIKRLLTLVYCWLFWKHLIILWIWTVLTTTVAGSTAPEGSTTVAGSSTEGSTAVAGSTEPEGSTTVAGSTIVQDTTL